MQPKVFSKEFSLLTVTTSYVFCIKQGRTSKFKEPAQSTRVKYLRQQLTLLLGTNIAETKIRLEVQRTKHRNDANGKIYQLIENMRTNDEFFQKIKTICDAKNVLISTMDLEKNATEKSFGATILNLST